ncbi:MAG TPA: hypothetical protein VGB69_01305 [Edaphobacter sp.]
MNHLPKIPPSSVRPDSSRLPLPETRSGEPRLYFVKSESRQSPQRTLSLFPHESEDARLTGETRSLFRRLLALNLPVVVVASAETVSSQREQIEKIA